MPECHNCLEPAVEYTGPRGNGSETVALLRTGAGILVFCSPECRAWWWDVSGNTAHDRRETTVADGVTPEQLSDLSVSHDGPTSRITP